MSGDSRPFEPPDGLTLNDNNIRPRLPRPGGSSLQGRLGVRNQNQNPHYQNNNFNSNRKRTNDSNSGPQQKRRWGGRGFKNQFQDRPHSNMNPSRYTKSPIQKRLERYKECRNNYTDDSVSDMIMSTPQDTVNNETEAEEIEATDFTVQVVNNNSPVTDLTRFKMLLNPRVQKAIKVIQSKRRDKQVILPSAVTPTTTNISLNERFGLL